MARLGQVIKKLNIGIATAVDFLKHKGFEVEQNPNLKLTDEQNNLLISEFRKDQNLKIESERLSQQRQEKEKPAAVAIDGFEETPAPAATEMKVEVERPHVKIVDKIDVEDLQKHHAPKVEEKKVVAEVKEEPKAPEVVVVPEPVVEPVVEPVKVVEVKKEEKKVEKAPATEEILPKSVKVEPIVETPAEVVTDENAEPAKDSTTELYALTGQRLSATPKVIGTIDLSTINNSTRPAKKTKEEKRKERIAKERKQQDDKRKQNQPKPDANKPAAAGPNKDNAARPARPNQNNAANNDKKKRKRIGGGERVDVNKAFPNQNNGAANNNAQQGRAKHHKRTIHTNVVSDDDVAKQIKETLARLTEGKKVNKKGAKYRKEKREANVQRMQDIANQEAADSKVLKLTEFVTANELAAMMDVPVTQIIQTCFNLGLFVSINQRLDAETINIVADEFGFKTEFVSAEVVDAINEEVDDEADLVSRPPIVTVMGHVDHGKTSLLDYIRKTNVIAGEAGGITQHIGAYNVTLEDGRHITFLDTPGHEAFTAMRARGAKATDIAIIIVAADDNVMPQTIEAINHASAAGVPIVFAINKIDRPGANPEKIKESLAAMNYLVEEWGGKYQSQDISAKGGLHINELLEKVLLEAELLDLKANPDRRASGTIIESSLDKGRGYVATVLVNNGTLRVGDVVLAGTSYGRVKAMFNERNQRLKEAGPSEPVIILGLNGAPQAGDNFNVFEQDHEAREIANKREQLAREQGLRTSKHLTLDEIGRRIALGNFQELNVIVKGDVDGSIEALSDSLIKLSTEEIQVNVIHKAVGQISESDVNLAAASNAIIIGFQVRPSVAARKLAEKEEIDIRLYSIIYDAIEEIKAAMEGMLAPEIKEEITATLEIRETFKITKVGTVAGCMVKEGKIKRGNKIRLIRDGIVIYTGELASLKRMKDDVKEVNFGYECGLNIQNYNDIRVGDIIESYEEVEVKKSL